MKARNTYRDDDEPRDLRNPRWTRGHWMDPMVPREIREENRRAEERRRFQAATDRGNAAFGRAQMTADRLDERVAG